MVGHGERRKINVRIDLRRPGQVLVYVGFNAALSRWPSTRVYAWTFLVPVVAVLVEAVRGSLPGVAAMIGIVLVILGVAIVNLPRAEGAPVGDAASPEETPVQPVPGVP
jgi:EamA-like transporter family